MDYNEKKLGLIDRLKIWNAKKIAEAQRNQYYKDTKELLEVDYSAVDDLKKALLIKKATKDASKLYKKVYGKNNDGVGETDFIEDYLVEHNLKQKN